jgi:ABC-2 type transport system permease protein
MNKILLIIQREYLSRLRKRAFIIGTILFPLFYLGLIFGTGYLAVKTTANLRIALIDSSGLFSEKTIDAVNGSERTNTITLATADADRVIRHFDSLGYDGYIVIPQKFTWDKGVGTQNAIAVNTRKTFGAAAFMAIEQKLNMAWNQVKRDSLNIDSAKQTIISRRLSVSLNNETNRTANSEVASITGYVCGFLMYLILLLYGSQVMMGVTEEKTTRIAEVVISSVKPFQLMIGKIVGIGLLALTQFLIWIACIFLIYNYSKTTGGGASEVLGHIQSVFTSVNMGSTIACFIFYLMGGFFFYASLYAAIGSSINEDMREAQSLSLPITLMVIFSIVILAAVIKDPNSPLAVWASIIPLSSPIIMMGRIPLGIPNTVAWWQLGLSMLFLVGGFLCTTWFAARVYRVGILMYGKKPSWKEMIKWAFK